MAVITVHRNDLADRLHAYLKRFAMTATERYEADAEAFYRETGLMAPGKDAPMGGNFGSESERRKGFDAWAQRRNDSLRDDIAAAVLFLRESPQVADAVDPPVGSTGTPSTREEKSTDACVPPPPDLREARQAAEDWLREHFSKPDVAHAEMRAYTYSEVLDIMARYAAPECYCKTGDDANREVAKRMSVRGPSPSTVPPPPDLREAVEQLKAAALAVRSTSRCGYCWCDPSWDVAKFGHMKKCADLAALLSPAGSPGRSADPPQGATPAGEPQKETR